MINLRYRAIMYPLRRKPSKLCSQIAIVLIWILSFAFALPMGIVHTFDYVPDPSHGEGALKPFCYPDVEPPREGGGGGGNDTDASAVSTKWITFQYYRYVSTSVVI